MGIDLIDDLIDVAWHLRKAFVSCTSPLGGISSECFPRPRCAAPVLGLGPFPDPTQHPPHHRVVATGRRTASV